MARLTNSPAERSVLEVEARKSFAFSVVVQAPNGSAVDLTGSSVTFTVGVDGAPVETAAIIDMPLSGTAVVPLQADDLALGAGSYPFTVTLRTGGYSLVLVKGELKVLANPEQASASQTYGGATPSTGLMATLVGLQVIKVTVWSGVPQGVSDGLDATGVTDGYLPTAQGDGTWAWQPPAVVDWSTITGTDAVVLRPELDAYAPLAGAAFTGTVSTPALEVGDAEVGLELRVGPESSQLSMAYGTISASEDGLPVEVSMPTGVTDLPAPIDAADAATKGYVDAQDRLVGVLGAAEDLDAQQTTGRWVQNSNASAAAGTNYPAPYAGLLEVFERSLVYQRYTVYHGAALAVHGQIYARSYSASLGWSAWSKVNQLDTGWVPATVNGSWTNEATDPLSFRRIGDVVHGYGRITGTLTVNSTLTVGSVPSQFWSLDGKVGFCTVYTTGAFVGWCNVNNLGVISIHFKSPWTTGNATISFTSATYTI